MNRIERSILAAALAALAMTARADPALINCVAPDGRTVYGDNADQCKSAPIRKLDRDGTPKDLIPAPPTEQQRKAKEEREEKQAKCRERNQKQYQKDSALLERYPREDDLQEARYLALAAPLKQINEANERLKKFIASGRNLAQQAAFFGPAHRMPDDLRKGRDLNRELERIEFRSIASAAHDILRINEDYDADLKRYRELVEGTAKIPCDPESD